MAIPLGINLSFCVKFERDDASILDAVRRSVDISETRIRMKVA